VVDLDAPLDQQFLEVAVRQPEAQLPADRQHDHLGREAKAGEGRMRDETKAGAASSNADSLAAARSRRRCNSAGGGTARQDVARVPVWHDPIRAEDDPSGHRAKDNSGAGP
jgi:hypothetical protein